MSGDARLDSRSVRFCSGECVGQGVAVDLHLEGRGADLDLPVIGEGVQEGVQQVLARQIVLRLVGIHVEVFGVIPFSP